VLTAVEVAIEGCSRNDRSWQNSSDGIARKGSDRQLSIVMDWERERERKKREPQRSLPKF